MQAESFRKCGRALAQRTHPTHLYAGLNTFCPVDLSVRGPINRVLVTDHAERGACLWPPFVQAASVLLHHSGRITLSDDAFGNQLVRVELAGSRVLTNDAIHDRLGGRGFVSFVVAETPVAN